VSRNKPGQPVEILLRHEVIENIDFHVWASAPARLSWQLCSACGA
jgi:hypothetical protein